MSSPAAGHNQIDKQVLARWLGEALRVYDELDAQKIDNMNRCRVIRGRLPGIYESAKAAGLPLKAFKLTVKAELFERAKAAIDAKLDDLVPEDDEDAEAYEALRSMARDGDLFDAAVKKREAGQGDDDGDVRPAFLRNKGNSDANGTEAQTAENVTRLKKGIKGMPSAPLDS